VSHAPPPGSAGPSPLAGVLAATVHPDAVACARRLTDALALPLLAAPPTEGLVLRVDGAGLALCACGPNAPGPLRVEFARGRTAWRGRTAGGRQPLARAVGFVRAGADGPPRILDATAGLGADAWTLAALGGRVLAVERHPVLHALLADGLSRARQAASDAVREAAGRIALLCGEATALPGLAGPPETRSMAASLDGQGLSPHASAAWTAHWPADAVYLDPMYPAARGSARPKKEMQLLRRLLGAPDPAEQAALLAAALSSGAGRVVVKRPRGVPALAGRPPDHACESKQVRFDVYLASAGPRDYDRS